MAEVLEDDFDPVGAFSLLGEKVNLTAAGLPHVNVELLLQDDEVQKLERLQLINASARYELLSAN